MRSKKTVGILLALVMTVLAACSTPSKASQQNQGGDSSAAGTPKKGGTLTVGIADEPDTLDPALSSLAVVRALSQQVFSTLVEFDTKMEVVPGLALKWDQPDPTTLIFHLRTGVKFHNGTPMTSADVKFSFERLIAKDSTSPWKGLLSCLDKVDATDPDTVTLKLNKPCSPILNYLAHPGVSIVSKAYVESGGNLKQQPVGTGPFKFVKWSGKELELTRNPDYYLKDQPYLDGLKILVNSDENARTTALRTGGVDFLMRTPETYVDILKKDAKFKVSGNAVGAFRLLNLNSKKAPLDDVRVRQAISYALDRNAIMLAAISGFGETLSGGPIPAAHWAAPKDPVYKQDLVKAKQLLADAGQSKGFKLPILTLSTWPVHLRAAQVIKEQLAPLGIDVQIEGKEPAIWLTDSRSANYMVNLHEFSGQVDPDQFMDRFRTGSTSNWPGWSNAQYDALLVQGTKATDQKERQGIYAEAQRLLAEQAPAIFLYSAYYFDVVKSDVMGYEKLFSEDYHLRKVWVNR